MHRGIRLIGCATLLGLSLWITGCAQQADMGRETDDDAAAASGEIDSSDSTTDEGEEARVDDIAPDDPVTGELAIDPPILPDRLQPKTDREVSVRKSTRSMVSRPDTAPRTIGNEDSITESVGTGRSEAAPPSTTDSETDDSATTAKPRADAPYDVVQVFYGTDRRVVDASELSGKSDVWIPLGAAAGVSMLFLMLGWAGWRRRLTLSLAMIGVVATLAMGGYWGFQSWTQDISEQGVRYGNARGTMAYGTCEVTIPKSHSTGEVERPSILRLEVREDATKHVVLQSTTPNAEDQFFTTLRESVQSARRPEVFVFVHGYNVTFEGAARRTAQIAHDVEFAGAPVFFSWPSQGGLLKYTVDENNVEWAVPHLRQFLIDVTQRSGAKSVNLIAHSMGNQALTLALRDLQTQLAEETMLFNQIILAAPDVDAEIFRRDLAPALVKSAQRVTLYASSNDQALQASKKVHGHARAGDSGAGLVVVPGIETIDVSTLDTSLLGHSYYGSSDPILLDIRQLIDEALPAAQRPFLLPQTYGGLTYWVFQGTSSTATRDVPGGPR